MDDYDLNLPTLVLVAVVSTILACVAIVGLEAVYHWQKGLREPYRAVHVDGVDESPDRLERLREDQRIWLAKREVLDAEKGVVCIPIGRAMELVVDELSDVEGVGDER